MQPPVTYRTEIVNGHTFEWRLYYFTSSTGGDYSRDCYRLDGKRVSARVFYERLWDARAAAAGGVS